MTHQFVGLLWSRDQPIAETSARKYTTLTTDIHNPVGFEPAIPASDGLQTLALDRSAIRIGD
jgi:hypothetical protein